VRASHANLTSLAAAKRGLNSAQQRKASVNEAIKACEGAVRAVEDALGQLEELEARVAGVDTAMRELRRLDAVVSQYKTAPTVKLFGKPNEGLTFWERRSAVVP
jgi:hypothetical protein